MNTLINLEARADKIKVTDQELIVFLVDGRKLEVPLVWFPKLRSAAKIKRNKYRLVGDGVGIHWSLLNEDILIEGLLGIRTG